MRITFAVASFVLAASIGQASAGPNFPCKVQWAEQLNMTEVTNGTSKTYPTGTKFVVTVQGSVNQTHVVAVNASFPPGATFPIDQVNGDPRSETCTAHLKR